MEYRALNPDEIIQQGDEFNNGVGGWHPCNFTIGDRVDTFWSGVNVRRPITPSIPVKDARADHFLVYYGVTSRRALKLSPTADIEKILVELATEPADFVNYVAENMGIVIDDEYIHEDEVTNGGFSLCVVGQDGYESTVWEEVPEEIPFFEKLETFLEMEYWAAQRKFHDICETTGFDPCGLVSITPSTQLPFGSEFFDFSKRAIVREEGAPIGWSELQRNQKIALLDSLEYALSKLNQSA